MKVFENVFDAEEDFGVGDTAPAPNRSLPSGGFDVEPFNFGATPSISGFGARAIPFDLKLANTVGDGEVNEPKDVSKTRRLLTVTGDLVPGGRTKTDPNGDVNLGIYGLQQRVGAKRDGYMRPRGETVTKALKTLFGAGGQNTPKPTPGARPAISAPAKTIDAFARAAKASPPPLPAVKPGGPDGIVLGGSVMAQSEGLTRRIETLAPRGYRFFPKMGSLAAHWVGPDLLPISEKRVQNLMRRFTAQGARKSPARAAPSPSRNATLAGDKAALPGQGGGTKPAAGSEAAVRGTLPTGKNKPAPGTPDPTFAQIGEGIAGGPVMKREIEKELLTKFNKQSPFRLRTAKGNRITFVGPNGAAIVTMPRAFAIQFAKTSGKGAEGRLRLIADIVGGRLSEKEIEARARALFVRKDPGPDANLIPALGEDVDREKMAGVRNALAAIRAGQSKAMVGKVLAYSLLPEGISNEKEVRAFLLDILPVIGNYRSARYTIEDVQKVGAAIKRGDYAAAVGHGLFAILDGFGAVPVIGNVAKPALRGAKSALLKISGLRRLARSPETEAQFLRRLEAFSVNPTRPNRDTIVKGIIGPARFERLTGTQRRTLLNQIGEIVSKGAEGYIAARITHYRHATGDAVRKDIEVKLPGQKPTQFDAAIVNATPWMQQLAIEQRVSKVLEIDKIKAIIIEVKTGKKGLSNAQKAVRQWLRSQGRGKDFRILTVPHKEIPAQDMLKVMENTSKNMDPAFRMKLVKQLKRRLPGHVPGWLFLDIYARVAAEFTRE